MSRSDTWFNLWVCWGLLMLMLAQPTWRTQGKPSLLRGSGGDQLSPSNTLVISAGGHSSLKARSLWICPSSDTVSASCPVSCFEDSQGCQWAGLWGPASLVLCQGSAQVCYWACLSPAKLLLVGSVLTRKSGPEGQGLTHSLSLCFSCAKCC